MIQSQQKDTASGNYGGPEEPVVQQENDARKSEEVPDRTILPEAPASSSRPCCVSIKSSSIGQLALTELKILTHSYPCAHLFGQSRAERQSHTREGPVLSVCILLARNETHYMRSRTVKETKSHYWRTLKSPSAAFSASTPPTPLRLGFCHPRESGQGFWKQDLPAVFCGCQGLAPPQLQ
ncbi:hypothetical protein BDW66DRAFT_64174 [Aspergillus desertorum]